MVAGCIDNACTSGLLSSSALRICLHVALLVRGGDSNKEQNKEFLKKLYNICH